jgi:hypothetical protein
MPGSALSLQQIGKWAQLVLSHLKRKRAQQIVLLTMIVHGTKPEMPKSKRTGPVWGRLRARKNQRYYQDRIYFIASFEQMADTAGMSKATAQKAVEELEKAKLVEVILTGTGRGHPNVYQLRLPELVEHPHHTMTVP